MYVPDPAEVRAVKISITPTRKRQSVSKETRIPDVLQLFQSVSLSSPSSSIAYYVISLGA